MPVANDHSAPVSSGSWSREQLRNAAIIYSVGKSMGLGLRDIQIALIAAMVESNLINVHYGDRDSLGLFQQRPSQGWGTPEQVMNPQYAAHKFFTTLLGLGDKRWRMGMGAAAQAVQRSAYPDRYAQRIGEMRNMFPLIERTAGDNPTHVDGTPYGTQNPVPDSTPYGYLPPNVQKFIEQYNNQYGQMPPLDALTSSGSILNDMLGSTVSTEADSPLANAILGPWDLSPGETAFDPMTDGYGTMLSQGTNQIIQHLQDSTDGGYAKGVDGWRKAVIAAAKGALGTPYVWGGNSLDGGVDCSGLVQQAFARAGLQLPRISFEQARAGARVGIKGLRAGDLVAWDNAPRNPGADHIAIYLGNGYIIEAPKPGLSVRIRKLGPGLEGGWGVHLNF